MRSLRLISIISFLLSTMVLAQSTSLANPLLTDSLRASKGAVTLSQSDWAAQAKVAESYGKLPLSFEANRGQADSRVKFLSRTIGYSLFLTGDEAVLALSQNKSSPRELKPASLAGSRIGARSPGEAMPFPKIVRGASSRSGDAATESMTGDVLRMKLRNANVAAKVIGIDELAGTSNYFIGNDPAKWRTAVPTYAKVKYGGIYSGIDLVYYGTQRQLEYDFIIAPGADPRLIAFDVGGAKRIRSDEYGDLVLEMKTGEGEIRWHKPVVYQEKDGARQEIAARYAITETNRVGFEIAKYDASRPLYIDPLIYSTYLGGNGEDEGHGIAVDNAGNAYVVGITSSTDFPTNNPLQPTYGGGLYDVFVAKLNPTGSALVYSTYLGGNSADYGQGIAVDNTGNAYVVGYTLSNDFPTKNPLQAALNGGIDAFVAKLDPTGSALVYSTYLGGSGLEALDAGGIAVDSAGNAYVTGRTNSSDFPTVNPLQPTYGGGWDGFVAKLNATGSALVYSTYLGGSSFDEGFDITVDRADNAYVTGVTESKNFPTTPGAFQTVCGGSPCGAQDAFVAKINSSGSALVYSTYLGGSGMDVGYGIAADNAGNAYVVGYTHSADFPTMNPLQTYGKNGDAFVTKLNATGSGLVYSTFLGGIGLDAGYGIAVDRLGDANITGLTQSKNFPTTPGAFQTVCNNGCYDAFAVKINPSGSALIYSTYLGGSGNESGSGIAVGLGSVHRVYLTGGTSSTDFPTKKPLQGAKAAGDDAFVTALDMRVVTTTALSSSPNPSIHGQLVTFTAVLTSSIGAPPDGETVTFKKSVTVLGTGALSGGSASFTTSALPVGTNPITAVYGGDSNFAGSTSKLVKQVVN